MRRQMFFLMFLGAIPTLCFGTATADEAPGFIFHPDGSVTAPDGLLWYPPVKNPKGLPETPEGQDPGFLKDGMRQPQAMICCNGPRTTNYPDDCPFGANGAHLPTKQEFDTLGKQLGFGTPQGYDPTPIPYLAHNWYWASHPGPGSPIIHYLFKDGTTGNWDPQYPFWVRCVERTSAYR